MMEALPRRQRAPESRAWPDRRRRERLQPGYRRDVARPGPEFAQNRLDID